MPAPYHSNPNLPPTPTPPFTGGLLVCTVLSGKNLLPLDKSIMGKKSSSDPYVLITATKQTGEEVVKIHQTKTIKRNLNPVFKSNFTFDLFMYKRELEVKVFDKDLLSNDDAMGGFVIDLKMLDDVVNSSNEVEYQLKPRPGCDEPTGSITLITQFYPYPNTTAIDGLFNGGVLEVSIVKAKNLLAMDSSLFSKKKSSDAFVKVVCYNSKTNYIELLGVTDVIKKNLNPTWNYQCSGIEIKKSFCEFVILDVYDKDKFSKDDSLGRVIIDLTSSVLVPNDNKEKWYKLQPSVNCLNPTGEIQVNFNYTKNESAFSTEASSPLFLGGKLSVGIKECRRLKLRNVNNFTPCNPYIVIQSTSIINKVEQTQNQYRTNDCASTQNPVFNDRVTVTLLENQSPLVTFALFDSDDAKAKADNDDDVSMGAASLDLNAYTNDGYDGDKIEGWFTVQNCKGCRHAEGEVYLSFVWAPTLSHAGKVRMRDEARRTLYEPNYGTGGGESMEVIMREAGVRIKELEEMKRAGDEKKEKKKKKTTAVESIPSELSLIIKKSITVESDVRKLRREERVQNPEGFVSMMDDYYISPKKKMARQPSVVKEELSMSRFTTTADSRYKKLIKDVEETYMKKYQCQPSKAGYMPLIKANYQSPQSTHTQISNLKILTSHARDDPIKYVEQDLRYSAITRLNQASRFTKFKPLHPHPLPPSFEKFSEDALLKRLHYLPRESRIFAAATYGSSWCIEQLFIDGHPCDFKNSTGFTPLHCASYNNNTSCINVILNIGKDKNSGVDVNAESLTYLTPLNVAISAGSVDAAVCLKEHGGVEKLGSGLPGFRSVMDVSLGGVGELNVFRKINRAADDKARNLEREAF